MPFNDKDYHARREREHRALAEAAATEKVKLVHLAMADQHLVRAENA